MTTVQHGGVDYVELEALGIGPGDVLDFSSNINPLGPPPVVRSALAALDPAPYPDRNVVQLRSALAQRYGCLPDAMLVGNGSNELIHLTARALLTPHDRVVVVEPTFGEYAHASRLAGARVHSVRTREEDGFRIDMAEVQNATMRQRPRLLWLCVPNNPTGVAIASDDLERLMHICNDVGSVLVIDAAYIDMQRRSSATVCPVVPHTEAVLVLHSLTKAYALAGLRLGCLVGSPPLVARIAAYQPTWSVNSAAQLAALAALADSTFLPSTLPVLWTWSDGLRQELMALGLSVLPSALPFFLVRVGDASRTRLHLLRAGCLVRDCTSFGLPAYVRVAPRTPVENQQLVAAWRNLCQHPS